MQELLDRHAIHDLLVDYCFYLDSMNLPALAALFTVDCEVIYGADPRLGSQGAAALEDSLERMWRWARTSHHLSNVRLVFPGPDTVDSTSYVLAWHERLDGSSATIYGQYNDRIIRTTAGWRIAERRMFMHGSDGGFAVPIAPLQRRPAPPGWEPPDLEC